MGLLLFVVCTVNSKINGTPRGVSLPISKLKFILAVANLLAHNSITINDYYVSKFASAKIECSFEMGK